MRLPMTFALRRALRQMGVRIPLQSELFIYVDPVRYEYEQQHVREQHAELTEDECDLRAAARCFALEHPELHRDPAPKHKDAFHVERYIILAVAIVLLIAILTTRGHCQSTTVIRGVTKGTTVVNSATVTSVDANHNAIDVNVAAGGGTGGGPADAAPNAAASESDVARQKVSGTIRVLDTSQAAGSQLVTATGNQASGLNVNCKAGCAAAGDTATGSTALGAANAVITIALAGERGAAFQLQSGGTGIYTVTPQCSFDGGTIYNANGYLEDPVTGVISLTATIASAQATTDYQVICPSGASNAQMKVTAYTSGTANWLARATVNTWPSLGFGIVTTAAPTYTTGTINGFSLTTGGALRDDITTWLGSTAPTVGSKTSANSIPVVIASDQGAVTVAQATAASLKAEAVGNKTNNNAVPGATNIGALTYLANAAQQTWTEGDLVLGSVNLKGSQRQVIQDAAGNDRGVNVDVNNNGQVSVIGRLADNGIAAATDRSATVPGIYQSTYLNGTAATQGRNAAQSVGTDGLLWTANLPAIRPASYHWSGSFAGSSTTFAAHIAGNATNTLLVTKITFSCTQTTAGNVTVTVNKTSAASTGGTAATLTAVPDDSTFAGASSVAQSFTGTGPTAGAAVGQIDAYKLGCMATGTAAPNDIYILNLRQKPIVLRGTAQTLEIGVGAAVTGGNYTVTFEGMEITSISP